MRYVYEGLGDFCYPKVYNSLPKGKMVMAKEVCNRAKVLESDQPALARKSRK